MTKLSSTYEQTMPTLQGIETTSGLSSEQGATWRYRLIVSRVQKQTQSRALGQRSGPQAFRAASGAKVSRSDPRTTQSQGASRVDAREGGTTKGRTRSIQGASAKYPSGCRPQGQDQEAKEVSRMRLDRHASRTSRGLQRASSRALAVFNLSRTGASPIARAALATLDGTK
jgi:hypothetical protein